eukprot:jgi/Picre1/34598/NNA_002066.t1
MKELRLNHTGLRRVPACLASMKRLRILELGSNRIESVQDVQALKALQSIWQLNLKGNTIRNDSDPRTKGWRQRTSILEWSIMEKKKKKKKERKEKPNNNNVEKEEEDVLSEKEFTAPLAKKLKKEKKKKEKKKTSKKKTRIQREEKKHYKQSYKGVLDL